MGFTRQYFQDHNFLLTRLSDEISDAMFNQHTSDFEMETRDLHDVRELADCRTVSDLTEITSNGVIQNAESAAHRPDFRLAILINDSALHYGLVRMFQTFSAEHRQAIEIFKDLREALSWLSYDDEEIEKLETYVNLNQSSHP